MNRAYYLLLLLLAAACGNADENTNAHTSPTSSATPVQINAQTVSATSLLDSLVLFGSETELRAAYGDANVKTDTLWGAEGNWETATYLFRGTPDEVAVVWQNNSGKTGIAYVKVSCLIEADKPIQYKGRWKTQAGVVPGLSLEKLQAINGKPFRFSGFGWDYGGGAAGWENGKLENTGISVQLVESPAVYEFMEQRELALVTGDHLVSSDEPVLKKMNVQVQAVLLTPEAK
ncbi:MAG: hypothetical protein IM638_15795 [Bacteroidetes bacterium]|nr:hypothetical protein [Bacteroidota bacterium]